MAHIRILDDHVRNRIAAGEVIERPASVVKELIENSIDADARKITVDAEKGGIDRIRVTDDGNGIPPDQLELALARHATSKVTSAEDLFRINTMGFRGEALPSIASISRFTVSSRPSGFASGRTAVQEGSGRPVISEAGMAEGTAVTADAIFFNVPARRKFLKSPGTELRHISRTVIRTALAYPEIEFLLSNNGKEILHFTACSGADDRIFQAFGKNIRNNLLSFEQGSGAFRVRVFGIKPGITRKNSKNIFSYVNMRYFRGKEVIHAVKEGYRQYIPRDEWPFVILFIDTGPDAVDVNVHPNKTEVRFRDPGSLHSLIRNTISGMLRQTDTAVSYTASDTQPFRSEQKPDTSIPDRSGSRDAFVREQGSLFETDASALSQHPAVSGVSEVSETRSGIRCMQIYNSYIIAEYEDKITVYDQHALHEGIIEQKLRMEYEHTSLPCQDLLIPEQVELTPDEKSSLFELMKPLKRLGFDIQEFSGNTVVIHSVPQIMDPSRAGTFVRDIIDLGSENGDTDEEIADHLLSSVINRIACHSSVRAGQKLSSDEIDSLLKEARKYPDSASCAHGRPSSFEISRSELAKRFKRT